MKRESTHCNIIIIDKNKQEYAGVLCIGELALVMGQICKLSPSYNVFIL